MNAEEFPFRLILIDRDPLALLGMRALVKERFPAVTVAATFDNLITAESEGPRHQPHAIVLDIEMDGGGGFGLPHRWRCDLDGPPCLARMENEHPQRLSAALKAGVRGVVLRREPSDAFFNALIPVASGMPHLSPIVTRLLAAGIAGGTLDRPTQELGALSPREREVFRLAGRGQNTCGVAERLGISRKTVQTHYARICTKLHLRDYAHLVRHAILTETGASEQSEEHN